VVSFPEARGEPRANHANVALQHNFDKDGFFRLNPRNALI
jgi:hypothetical protein